MITDTIRKLTDQYDKGLMTLEEYLEELEGVIAAEWRRIEEETR